MGRAKTSAGIVVGTGLSAHLDSLPTDGPTHVFQKLNQKARSERPTCAVC